MQMIPNKIPSSFEIILTGSYIKVYLDQERPKNDTGESPAGPVVNSLALIINWTFLRYSSRW